MGWAIGYDEHWKRDIGYGVPATCDHPGCGAEIDRGLGYVCGDDPYGGEIGCGLFFCADHVNFTAEGSVCERCQCGREPFDPTPDLPRWIAHKLTHESWQQWRDENPEEVAALTPAASEGESG